MKTQTNPIQLFIHTPTNEVVSFSHVTPEATIGELKSQLELKTGILVELQSLYLTNIKLEDNKTLNEKQIKNGTVLRVKIKEKSLEEIYVTAAKGNIDGVFKLGVEFVNVDGDENNDEGDGDQDEIQNQLNAWNTFVPLRAFQALFSACCAGHIPLINSLLTKGSANIGMVSRNKRSVLHVAAYHGHLTCVSFLLSRGADSKLIDIDGLSAMSLAAQNGHIKVEKRLWLFNWNMNAINDTASNEKVGEKITEKEMEHQEVKQAAKQYQLQFHQRSQEDKKYKKNTLPVILTEKSLNSAEEPSNQNLHKNDVKLPKLSPDNADVTKKVSVKNSEDLPTKGITPTLPHHGSNRLTTRKHFHQRSLSDEPRTSKLIRKHHARPTNNPVRRSPLIIPSPPATWPYDGTSQVFKNIELTLLRQQKTKLKTRQQRTEDSSQNQRNNKPTSIQLDSIDLKGKDGPTLKYIIPTKLPSQQDSIAIASPSEKRNSVKMQSTNDEMNKPVSSQNNSEEILPKTSEIEVIITRVKDVHEEPPSVKAEEELRDKEVNRVWRPECSIPEHNGVNLTNGIGKYGKTFEEWLQEKQELKKQHKKLSTNNFGDSNIDVEKDETLKRQQNKEAFERWVLTKAKQKQNNSSKEFDSSDEEDEHIKRTQKGFTFEKWLENKRQVAQVSTNIDLPERRPHLARPKKILKGISFQEWKASKLEEKQSKFKKIAQNYEQSYRKLQDQVNGSENATAKSSYEKWVQRKKEERKINMALEATIRAQEQQEESMKTKRRMYDPRLKTFEEWLLEKQYSGKAHNKQSRKDDIPKRYPEDSNLIFKMWLAQKFTTEMAEERNKLHNIKGGNPHQENEVDDESAYSSDSSDSSAGTSSKNIYGNYDDNDDSQTALVGNSSSHNKIEVQNGEEDDSLKDDSNDEDSVSGPVDIGRNEMTGDKNGNDSSTNDTTNNISDPESSENDITDDEDKVEIADENNGTEKSDKSDSGSNTDDGSDSNDGSSSNDHVSKSTYPNNVDENGVTSEEDFDDIDSDDSSDDSDDDTNDDTDDNSHHGWAEEIERKVSDSNERPDGSIHTSDDSVNNNLSRTNDNISNGSMSDSENHVKSELARSSSTGVETNDDASLSDDSDYGKADELEMPVDDFTLHNENNDETICRNDNEKSDSGDNTEVDGNSDAENNSDSSSSDESTTEDSISNIDNEQGNSGVVEDKNKDHDNSDYDNENSDDDSDNSNKSNDNSNDIKDNIDDDNENSANGTEDTDDNDNSDDNNNSSDDRDDETDDNVDNTDITVCKNDTDGLVNISYQTGHEEEIKFDKDSNTSDEDKSDEDDSDDTIKQNDDSDTERVTEEIQFRSI